MWLAFVIVLTTSGDVQFAASPIPFKSEKECIAATTSVEDRIKDVLPSELKGVLAYKFNCIEVNDKTFHKVGVNI